MLRSGYDAHLIVSAVKLRHGKINVIPLHVLYYQQRLVYRLASIYVVLPQQIIQQLEQSPIQGDQKIFRVILGSKTKSVTSQ